MAILMGYQYFFVSPPPPAETVQSVEVEQGGVEHSADSVAAVAPSVATEAGSSIAALAAPGTGEVTVARGREITVETSLYTAVISENGGVVKSFRLKEYREELAEDSGAKELVIAKESDSLPLAFGWGMAPAEGLLPILAADRDAVRTSKDGTETLVLSGMLPAGLHVVKELTFDDKTHQIQMAVTVTNTTGTALQGAPFLRLVNRPFSPETASSKFLFHGPAAFVDGVLEEVDTDELKKGSTTMDGSVSWVAYEDTYFMSGIIPQSEKRTSLRFSLADGDRVTTLVSADADVIVPQGQQRYEYGIYFGPKKLSALKALGNNLDRIVNFGWLDILAKPTLYLINYFYGFVKNYGIAIILVTVLIKLLFWPISHKGMKSMKTMQKLQPKMAKLREKYKDDRERLNQEMMRLYQTYKVNPVGGCMPMVLQIPVFFALYKVLLQTIELRHAPFMLWITDLSAPDRLYIGFDLPFLGGLPVLTLLMGGSMFLQQKMTPTTGDPTQAKIMMFLPLIFTFMFINFASGLVLYWFVNNLLSIAQQYAINRQPE